MCIIVCKDKGQDMPKEDILRRCFIRNDDGAGFAYNLNNKVYIKKGFMTFEDLKKALDTLAEQVSIKDIGLVIHFRIGTAGTNGAGNTHPYPLTNKWWNYKTTDMTTGVAVFHNGIINGYSPDKKNKHDFNDTQLYIMKRLAKLPQYFYKKQKWLDTIGKETASRLAFIDADGNIYKAGSGWVEDDGIYYSNTTYMSYTYGKSNIYSYYDYADYYGYYDEYYKNNKTLPESKKAGIDEDDDIYFDSYEELGRYIDTMTPILPNSEIYLDDSYSKNIYVYDDDMYFADDLLKAYYKLDFHMLTLEFMGYYADIVEY